MAKRHTKLHAKFAKLAELNTMIDARNDESRDARKAKSRMNDKWAKREARTVEGLFKRKNAMPGLCFQVRA